MVFAFRLDGSVINPLPRSIKYIHTDSTHTPLILHTLIFLRSAHVELLTQQPIPYTTDIETESPIQIVFTFSICTHITHHPLLHSIFKLYPIFFYSYVVPVRLRIELNNNNKKSGRFLNKHSSGCRTARTDSITFTYTIVWPKTKNSKTFFCSFEWTFFFLFRFWVGGRSRKPVFAAWQRKRVWFFYFLLFALASLVRFLCVRRPWRPFSETHSPRAAVQ